jgi:imidazolonepropionase-like amidohydrolase
MRAQNILLILPLLMIIPYGSWSQQTFPDVPDISDTYVIRNATVTISPGKLMTNQSVLVEDGLIKAVGTDISIPSYAQEIAGDSLYVYAGFIAGLSHIGVQEKKPDQERPSNDDDENRIDPGNPPDALAGITPGLSVADKLDQNAKSIENFRKAGFTLAHTVGENGMLPGKGAIIFLSANDESPHILSDDISVFARLQGARRMYPGTTIGVMAKFRDLFRQAELLKKHEELYASNQGIQAPVADKSVKALIPAQKGTLPVYFEAQSDLDIHRVLQLQSDLQFRLVLAEVKEGWRIADMLKEKQIPVLISLELPEEKEDKDKKKRPGEEKDPEKQVKEQEEPVKDPEIEALKARQAEARKDYYSQAATLHKAGVPFGISLLDIEAKDVLKNIRRMAKNGLSEEAALAALTTYPASLLGVEKHTGTIEKGRIANLVVFTAPFLEKKAHLKYVFVNGELFTYEEPETKGKTPPARILAAILGNWNYKVEAEEDVYKGVLKFEYIDETFTGSINVVGTAEEEFQDLEDLRYEDGKLRFELDFPVEGQPTRMSVEITFEEDTFAGTVVAGEFGTYEITGERIPN